MKLGKSATEAYSLIQQVYGGVALSLASVFQWHKRFRERLETTVDGARSDRFSAMRTPKNGERFRYILQQNCQITVRMFSELLYIGKMACHNILHVDPGSPAVLIKFGCAIFSFVLFVTRRTTYVACVSQTLNSRSFVVQSGISGPRQCYQLLYSILQGDRRLIDITAGMISWVFVIKNVHIIMFPDFGRLQSYGRLKFRIECQHY